MEGEGSIDNNNNDIGDNNNNNNTNSRRNWHYSSLDGSYWKLDPFLPRTQARRSTNRPEAMALGKLELELEEAAHMQRTSNHPDAMAREN